MEDNLLYFNGLNGVDGTYDLPPMTGDALAQLIRAENPPENIEELRYRQRLRTEQHLGVVEGIDPNKLNETGWGIIFTHDADPSIKDALGELLRLRQEQAGELYRVYEGEDGYRPGESKPKFCARHRSGPGPVDPRKLPYYLLLVGSPEQIPYQFQYQLDVQYAVGRIYFDTLQEYANYARSIVLVEKGEVKRSRHLSFFSATNPDDKATNLSTEHLVQPLYQQVSQRRPEWKTELFQREQATKSQLSRLLGGDQTPALLFTASHGMAFPKGHALQRIHQGALVCQDWPGPRAWRRAIPQDYYFAGDDLADSANVLGMLVFSFACYGAGTPLYDEFSKAAFKERAAIAQQPFLAELPTKLLGHTHGGALALIGHVERAWSYSFNWTGAGTQTAVFESTLERLLAGHPIGSAVEYFNERYAELASDLSVELENIGYGAQVNPYDLAGAWTANNDARSYAIIGDPAVRLKVTEANEMPVEQPSIEIKPFSHSGLSASRVSRLSTHHLVSEPYKDLDATIASEIATDAARPAGRPRRRPATARSGAVPRSGRARGGPWETARPNTPRSRPSDPPGRVPSPAGSGPRRTRG